MSSLLLIADRTHAMAENGERQLPPSLSWASIPIAPLIVHVTPLRLHDCLQTVHVAWTSVVWLNGLIGISNENGC